jgi:hypothetical protein
MVQANLIERAYPKTTTGNETAPFLSLAILLQCKEEEKSCMYDKKKVRMGAHPQEVQGK